MNPGHEQLPVLVRQITELRITGNMIPNTWTKFIVHGKKKEPDFLAMHILSDTVYWYRASVKKDEETGLVIHVKKRFTADKLQRSYAQLAELFSMSKARVKQSIDLLIDQGLIEREFRNITPEMGSPLNNVMFLAPVPDKIREISFPRVDKRPRKPAKSYNVSKKNKVAPSPETKAPPSPDKSIAPSPKTFGGRIQETTTEITTEVTTEKNPLYSLAGGKGTSPSFFSSEIPYPSIPENAASTEAVPTGGAPTTEPQSPGETLSPEPVPDEDEEEGWDPPFDLQWISNCSPEELDAERVKITALKRRLREQQAERLMQTRLYPLICAIFYRNVAPEEMIPMLSPLRTGTISANNLLFAAAYSLLSQCVNFSNIPDLVRALKEKDDDQYLARCRDDITESLALEQEIFHREYPDADLEEALESLRETYGSVIIDFGYDRGAAQKLKDKCDRVMTKQTEYWNSICSNLNVYQGLGCTLNHLWEHADATAYQSWDAIKLAALFKLDLIQPEAAINDQRVEDACRKASEYRFVRDLFSQAESGHPALKQILDSSETLPSESQTPECKVDDTTDTVLAMAEKGLGDDIALPNVTNNEAVTLTTKNHKRKELK